MELKYSTKFLTEEEEYNYIKECATIECPDFTRVGTWTICNICGKPYVSHPYIIPHFFLNLLCDGRIVKL